MNPPAPKTAMVFAAGLGTLREGAEAVAHKAEDFWTDTTNLIRRYPVASLMIAFGAGCLCASLFRMPHWSDDVARRMSRSA